MRRLIQEEPVNHERWLVSYSDFITLLFAFFVVMYSLAQLSDSEFENVATQLSQRFANSTIISNDQTLNDIGPTAVTSTLRGDDFAAEEGNVELTPSALDQSPLSVNGMPLALQALQNELQNDLQASLQDGRVGILGNEQWLEIDMGADVLFQPNSAVLKREGRQLLQRMALRLKDMPNAVRVEGFTDDGSVTGSIFESSWALSAARAANVAQLLQMSGVQPHRLAAVGFGEFQPLTSNESVLGRAVNRRVVLSVSADNNPRPGRAGMGPILPPSTEGSGESPGENYRTWVDEVSEALDRVRVGEATRESPPELPEGLDVIRTKEGGILITRDEQ
ncbi:MAG TPA: flagellar motor protein MotB [Pseudomonadales bacterium]|nr:flagellar motor protein MotB [Pseudomonadales bacterium]